MIITRVVICHIAHCLFSVSFAYAPPVGYETFILPQILPSANGRRIEMVVNIISNVFVWFSFCYSVMFLLYHFFFISAFTADVKHDFIFVFKILLTLTSASLLNQNFNV